MRAKNVILITEISIVISKCRATSGNSGQCSSINHYVVTIKTWPNKFSTTLFKNNVN